LGCEKKENIEIQLSNSEEESIDIKNEENEIRNIEHRDWGARLVCIIDIQSRDPNTK